MCTLICTLAIFVTGYAIKLLCMNAPELYFSFIICCHPDK